MSIRKPILAACAIAALVLTCDAVVAAGAVEFEGSRINDSVTAREGGAVQWRFFTGGPVRYEPAGWGQDVYVGSDDGHLYCLEAASGKLLWKFFAGPSNRKMIGNERLVSVWHISGGPVVQDGKVFFAAGTWPMMGVFIYCLDATTGKIAWVNDHTDAEWQPMSFRRQNWNGKNKSGEDDPDWSQGLTGNLYGSMPYSVAPKGQCTIKEGRLVVPCGRAIPAYFDLKTGELLRQYTYNPQDRQVLAGSVDRHVTDGQERLVSRTETANWEYKADRAPSAKLPPDPVAGEILKRTQASTGYCLVLGIGDGRLIEGLLADSSLRLVVIDPDAGKVDALRRKMDAAGYYGMRVAALVDDPMNAGLPPYFASLIVVADPAAAGAGSDAEFARKTFYSLRPYGGVACLSAGAVDDQTLSSQVKKAALDKASVTRAGDYVLLRRVGALTGAGAWSHQYGSAGNTCSTGEELAQAPLGALWYGGAAGDAEEVTYAVERGGRGVIPLVVGGRILYEHGARRRISATDVYTGQLLWQWTPPDPEPWVIWPDQKTGKYWASYGSVTLTGRMAATEDAVYVVSGTSFYGLNATTGKPLPGFNFAERDQWGSPKVWKGTVFLPSGKRVLALDRHTGKVQWSFDKFGGVLAAGGGKVFCLQTKEAEPSAGAARLVALGAAGGASLWNREMRVGAKTNRQAMVYSEEQDMLLTATGAYVGQSGESVERGASLRVDTASYGTSTLLLKDRAFLVNNPKALGGLTDLATGAPVKYADPITGAETIDRIDRGKSHLTGGCGPAVAGECLATFRLDTAAYYDFRRHSGVCNIGGIRPSCTAGMIPADGLVCILNNSVCICRYPIFTTLALVHMPEAEMWTYFPGCDPAAIRKPVKQLGINFGAPGARLAENGTLWLDYPVVGGPSPKVEIATEPAKPTWFRYHASRVTEGPGIAWVCSSGAKDLKSVTIQVNGGGPYLVREYYAEPIAENDLKLRSTVVEHRNVKASASGKLKWDFSGKGYVCGLEIIDEAMPERRQGP